jgi:pimeloyl-ACP methyl ester carboxylesterase
MHRRIFTVAITGISRMLILRDRMLGRIGPGGVRSNAQAEVSRHKISSGSNVVDALFVRPMGREPEAVVLICHGIGEVVERWFPVQQLLAANGVASLVFDYSGYGRSTGRVTAAQCEQDTVAAFEHLQSLMPGSPVSILGFSLGSGIAAAIVHRVAASRLVLCASFTSFRAAALSLGVPKRFASAVPDIWRTTESLRDCPVPVLVVHGARDRLFPVQMASDLKSFCGPDSELVVVPNLSHNEPFYRPRLSYWGLIVSRLVPALQLDSLR